MIQTIHFAAQYLSAATLSFLEKKDDDSQSNMAWNAKDWTIETRKLNAEGIKLCLDLKNYQLAWSSEKLEKIDLASLSHQAIVNRLKQQSKKANLGEYRYEFHYELENQPELQTYQFPRPKSEQLAQISFHYSFAQLIIQHFLKAQGLDSELRIWPHHFDLGAFVKLQKFDLGLGLAIPDDAIDQFYFYATAYREGKAIDTKNLKELNKGVWQSGDWKAGTLELNHLHAIEGLRFFEEVLMAYELAEK